MTSLRELLQAARAELPEEIFCRWAAVFFSLFALTLVISLAASQAFLAVAGAAYLVHLVRARPAVKFPPIKLPLGMFCVLTILSVFAASNPAAGWLAIRKLVLFAIFLLAVNLIVTPKHLRALFHALFLTSALAGLVAAAQFVAQYRSVRALHPEGIYYYMTLERITGFMGHWMNFGGQQMLTAVALAAFLLLARRAGKVWWIVMAVVALSIVLNFTRGVWLGCFVAAVYLIARWKPRWLLLIPVLVVAVYFAAPRLVRERVQLAFHPMSDPALSIRFEMWRNGWRMVQAHPWLGVGPNNIAEVYDLYLPPRTQPEAGYHSHLHNNFIQFAAERGLPCLAAWVWLMAALGWNAWRIRRKLARSAHAWVADAALAGWLAFVVEGCFEFNFGTSPVLMVFLFLMSTPYVAEPFASDAKNQAAPQVANP